MQKCHFFTKTTTNTSLVSIHHDCFAKTMAYLDISSTSIYSQFPKFYILFSFSSSLERNRHQSLHIIAYSLYDEYDFICFEGTWLFAKRLNQPNHVQQNIHIKPIHQASSTI